MTHKIAVVVQGRFYTFDMAKALLARGHDVHLFTNYPRWAVARFGFPPERVTSCWPHGIAARLFTFLKDKLHVPDPESLLHKSFGRWAARQVPRQAISVHKRNCWKPKNVARAGRSTVQVRG